jgi:hypothetical protein
MRLAAHEYGNWFTDSELERLRREWIAAYRAWIQVDAPRSDGAVLTDDQRVKLRRYHDAESAYFARSRVLAGGTLTADAPVVRSDDASSAESEPVV